MTTAFISVTMRDYPKTWNGVFLKFLMFLFALFHCFCSSEQPTIPATSVDIPPSGSAHTTAPLPSLLSEHQKDIIAKAALLTEVIPVVSVVKLQVTDESVIGDISDLVYFEDHFYILDRLQAKIFLFQKDGLFVSLIGRKGQGPGEYSDPATIRRCFNGNIAVLDGLQGRVHVFSKTGEFLLSTPRQTHDQAERIIPQKCFIWDTPDRLYLAAIASQDPKSPWHIILDSHFKIVNRFGRREDVLLQAGMHSWGFTAFEKVGGRLWAGSPYKHKIDLYNLDGDFLEEIGAPQGANALTEEILKEAARKKDAAKLRWMLVKTDHTLDIIASEKVVFVRSPNHYDLYDTNGHLLKSGLNRNKIRGLLDASGDYFYSDIMPFNTTEHYSKEDYQALCDAGFRLENNINDNPYIRIGELVQ